MRLTLLFSLLVYKTATSCLHPTFSNTSVTVSGIRRPFSTIDGCFGPEKNLEKVSLIQILNETVPVLHEDAFHDLDYLLDVILESDGIREVKPGAFRNLPKIYSIRLKNNEIREIRNGVFSGLSLSELSLVNNKIERIESGALDDLPNLSIVQLADNELSYWDPRWFRGSPKITVLNFENNFIRKVPSGAFQNVRGVHVVNNLNVSTSVHLNRNKIELLEDGAFEGPETLGWLFLQRNELRSFNENALGKLRQLDWLRLDNNRLECIPEKLLQIVPNVIYYLEGNPLTEECVTKYNITTRGNGFRINKLNISID